MPLFALLSGSLDFSLSLVSVFVALFLSLYLHLYPFIASPRFSIQSSSVTMSEGGERMCPLCAEEMDLTDQHLKPCKCGYEICVWCWHHIIDMAEKDETEGRCPACRTPYNKEKIVGMTANTEKLASEMCVEKKLKSHKGKSKTSEGRKQLGSVRVIQRNLVYVLGLPLNFADEDLLQRKEYFGQYGKVLKASISRTATGAIQHFANSTCSVYITFSKEEEAIRCIQSVNGFIMDARPIKACFGTTKYCHAWLRNMPCSNPDCLYLHEIGSQEDSFTKDEVISAYTRSRVQQITGATNSMQRSSGNVLPSPADENSNNSPALTGKLINKTATCTNQNSANGSVISPPNSSSGRTAALPAGASWGTRSFNNQPLSATTPCSNGPLKPDACNGLVASSAEVANTIQVSSLQTNTGKKLVPVEENFISLDKIKLENLVPAKKESKPDSIAGLKSSSISVHPMTSPLNHQLHGIDTTKSPNNLSKMVDSSLTCGPALDNNSMDATDEIMENICSDFLLIGVHNHAEQIKEVVTSEAPGRSANMTSAPCFTEGLSDFGLVIPTQAAQDLCETKDDMLSFDNQRLKDPEVSARINHLPDIFNSIHMPKLSTVSSVLNTADASSSVDLCGQVVDKKDNSTVSPSNFPLKFGGHPYSSLNSVDANDVEYSNLFSSKDKKLQQGRYEGELAIGAGNMGENSIISNILSMDLDSLDESLTSPQNLAKFLGETDKSQGSFGVSGSWKIQNSNQSRFSFAREDTNQATHFGPSSVFVEKDFMQRSFANDVPYSNNMHLNNDKFATRNNFPFLGGTETDVFANNHPHISSNKLSASRSQISAPPGFSATSRTAPPGFSSYEMADQILGTLSGNHILDTSSFSRNQWQTPPSNHTFSHCDIEFMDPAILEVRHGTLPGDINSSVLDVRSSYSPQLNSFEESRLQSFLQRSLPPHTNQRINELGDGFSSIADAYGVRSRVMEQTLSNNFSPFSQVTHPQPRNAIASNGQWNGWNEGTGANNLGMAELLRNERLGFNKLYGGYEDSKIHMPSSGNMYNGSYGI